MQTTKEMNQEIADVDSQGRSQDGIKDSASYMFAFIMATGVRVGELCALETGDISWVKKYIDITKTAVRFKYNPTGKESIKVSPPKTECSNRRVPLSPAVEDILDKQALLVSEMQARAGDKWNDNTLVFPTAEGNIHDPFAARSMIERFLKREGKADTSIYAARHAYAAAAMNNGVSAQDVARALGVKDYAAQDTADIYRERGPRER